MTSNCTIHLTLIKMLGTNYSRNEEELQNNNAVNAVIPTIKLTTVTYKMKQIISQIAKNLFYKCTSSIIDKKTV